MMKKRVLMAAAAGLLLQACANRVDDRSDIAAGNSALVLGTDIAYVNHTMVSIGDEMGIEIQEVDGAQTGYKTLEVALTEGVHELLVECSYKDLDGFIVSSRRRIRMNVAGGYVYQLNAKVNEIRTCQVKVQEMGDYETLYPKKESFFSWFN